MLTQVPPDVPQSCVTRSVAVQYCSWLPVQVPSLLTPAAVHAATAQVPAVVHACPEPLQLPQDAPQPSSPQVLA